MKIQCHRPTLAAAFQVVSGVVPARTPKDILKNVKLEVRDGAAVLCGTDSEVGIRYALSGVEIEREGETLLPTSSLMAILREVQDNSVVLELNDDGILVQAGHSEFRLQAADPLEFPPVAGFEATSFHTLTGSVLREAIRRTVFATDTESTRYALGGVLLDRGGDAITLAATDSRRLAVVRITGKSEGNAEDGNAAPVIPSKAMQLLERSITEDDQDVSIAVQTNDVLVKSGPAVISARLVEGRFPKYRDVVPDSSTVSVDLSVGPFLSAVRQAQIVTNDESRGVDFTFTDGLLKMDSQAADVGRSTVELPISYDAADLTITFDPRFVAEFLRVLEPENNVRLDLIDAESAAVFHTDDAYTYVIMPLSRER
ncbi:MAG: DNA polymerase III subunit beta [Planctomycetaceae bacterium]